MGALLLAGLVGAVLGSVSFGALSIPLGETVALLGRRLGVVAGAAPDPVAAAFQEKILLGVRLPRALLSCLAGAALSLCGAVMQGVFRNPLADPYLLGVTSGAAVGSAATLLAVGTGSAAVWYLLPAGGLAGGLVAVALVYLLASLHAPARHGLDTVTLILVGVALAAVFSSLSTLLLYLEDHEDFRRLVFWLLGNLAASGWPQVAVVAGATAVCAPALLLLSRDLNALSLGDLTAAHLGLSPSRTKRWLLGLTAILTAVVVAVTGMIGFVGLIVPHAARLVVGPDHRALLPTAALGGALFLLVCDTLARTVLSPVELPVGIVTSLIGSPVFLVLLLGRRERGGRGLSR